MPEKEKEILEVLAKAVPNMSDFNKGYLLGMGEAVAANKKETTKDKENKAAE